MKRLSYIALIMAPVCTGLLIYSCVFDPELPLENDLPECSSHSEIETVLYYPDSSVCTLAVTDLNDEELQIGTLPCRDTSADTVCIGSGTKVPWPGTYRYAEKGLGTKRICFFLDTGCMGRYQGILLLEDSDGAACALPYRITKVFRDPFDTLPLQPAFWRPYIKNYGSNISFDYIDRKLVFSFKKGSASSASPVPVSTGIRSVFFLQSSFSLSIDFKLRDEMDDAFELGFFVSSSPDTGRWDGEKAGFFISGIEGQLRLECRSVNLQSYSYETGSTAGELGIGRSGTEITYFFHDGNPAAAPVLLATQKYHENLPVYVHLKMTCTDREKERNCYWNDFIIRDGTVSVESE